MSHMQSKTWKEALLASTSLLAIGVPMAAESWQLKGIKYLDMWKRSINLRDVPADAYGMPCNYTGYGLR